MRYAVALLAAAVFSPACTAAEPLALGSRRELLLDDHLIERMQDASLVLHQPQPQEVSLVCNAPWEGNTSGYFTLFQDGDIYRCYYRGTHYDESTMKGPHPETTCYAESRDGIRWTKPSLGLVEFDGSKNNNIVLMGEGCTNFSPMLDTNPACPPESRYKALASTGDNTTRKKRPSLTAWHSPDGLRWTRMRDEPVITVGSFDSQNTAFFDAAAGVYRAYWRYFTGGYTDERGWQPKGVRAIRTATSTDFLHWENQADLDYGPDAPAVHLYTNAVRPYGRAPHLLVGFPTRYQPKSQQVEPVLITSRDGVHFRRWEDALIPITAPEDRDWNRSNYMATGALQLPGRDNELSVYATEAYYRGPGSRLRRFTYRMDGFVSASAAAAGELLTRPLTFSGAELVLNIASRGESRVEVQDAEGTPIPGFALADCSAIRGDDVDLRVSWSGGSLKPLVGQTIRLRFVLRDADLYALQFAP